MDEQKFIKCMEILVDGTAIGLLAKGLKTEIENMKKQLPKVEGEIESSFAKGFLYGLEKTLEQLENAILELVK